VPQQEKIILDFAPGGGAKSPGQNMAEFDP